MNANIDILENAALNCDGQQNCDYALEKNNIDHDPCQNIYKYTRLQYECKDAYIKVYIKYSLV